MSHYRLLAWRTLSGLCFTISQRITEKSTANLPMPNGGELRYKVSMEPLRVLYSSCMMPIYGNFPSLAYAVWPAQWAAPFANSWSPFTSRQ
jgi:hypothetical protein